MDNITLSKGKSGGPFGRMKHPTLLGESSLARQNRMIRSAGSGRFRFPTGSSKLGTIRLYHRDWLVIAADLTPRERVCRTTFTALTAARYRTFDRVHIGKTLYSNRSAFDLAYLSRTIKTLEISRNWANKKTAGRLFLPAVDDSILGFWPLNVKGLAPTV
jgi:hypothetical protein